ncbi:hypothetical protein [Streptomyces sp. NPDC092370]|uniref:hypothetical protein n=1 Tax=Streptomyces sp. NPDC092370 TaxID=3366016 RepID=UPI00382FE0A9
MLTSLLPGLRHFRTPFAVGTICAFQAWIVFGQWVPARDKAHGFIERLYVLGEVAGRPVVASLITVVIYLMGDVLKISTRLAARINYGKEPDARHTIITLESYHALRTYLERLDHDDDQRSNIDNLMLAVIAEFPDVRMRLIANHLDVYMEHDRFDSEAEFRVNIGVYSLSLWILLSIYWSPWALMGLPISAVFFRNGIKALREANTIIVQSLVSGIASSRTYEQEERRLKEMDAW